MVVIVNDEIVDVTTPIVLKFTCADIAETKNVRATHTNNLKCPANKNNNSILENSNTISYSGTAPYKKLECFLKGGSDLLMKGIGILENSEGGNYNLQVYSGNKLPFDKMGDKLISELPLSDLNHFRNFNTIRASRFNTDGFIYAFVDIGDTLSVGGGGGVNVERLLPCVFVHDLISRIEAEIDSTFTGEIFTPGTEINDHYKSLIIPCLDIKANEGLLLAKAEVSITPVQVITSVSSTAINFNDVSDPQEAISAGGAMQIRPVPIFPVTGGWTYRALFDGEYSFEIKFRVTLSPGLIARFRAFNTVTPHFKEVVHSNFNNNSPVTIDVVMEISNLKMFTGNDFFIGASRSSSTPGSIVFHSGTFEVTDVKNATSPLFGSLYDVAANLPKIKQKDLIKTILGMFSGICDTDSFDNSMRIFSTEELETNKNKAVSMGTRDDDIEIVAEGEGISYRLEGYGQKTWYKYKEDNTVPDGYGDHYLTVNDETLPLEETQIELPFAATVMVERFANTYLAPLIEIIPPNTFGTVTPGAFNGINKVEPRILILEKVNGLSTIYSAPSTGASATHSDSIPLCYFHNPVKDFSLHFQVLLDLYYNVVKASLNECKVNTKLLRWSEAQISKLRFDIPLFSKKDSQYFRLIEIEGYKAGAKSKTKMIRI